MRLYSQAQLCIEVVPPTDFLDEDHSWDKVRSGIDLDYSGQEIFPAQMMTWEQVKAALPQPGKPVQSDFWIFVKA